MPAIGEVYYYPNYSFPDGGEKNKYVVIMGTTVYGDFVLGRTTTKENLRVRNPACDHTDPYPGFYLNRADGIFYRDSWLALDRLDDHEEDSFNHAVTQNSVSLVGVLSRSLLLDLLDCARTANDTTKAQDNAIANACSDLRP